MVDFGGILKEWRGIRRMSQLDLALTAEVSSRHISFLETGRAKASRDMALRLGEELQMPLDMRNQLLLSAGLAPAYGSAPISAEDRAPLQQAVDWMLERHAPFPALAIDHHWVLQGMNPPAAALLAASGLQLGDSLIEALIVNQQLRSSLVNLDEVEALILHRLRSELASAGKDAVLAGAVARLQRRVGSQGWQGPGEMPAVIPTHYRFNGVDLKLFSTLSQFTSTGDVAMSELRLELMFPADAASKETLLSLFSGSA
ncbi:helix-turn-helix transcriptional regulator [Pseudophaeobacter sp. EL27]|uniref:MmyB family transcriptional regulator n=1 Tax=Pseudophaeobacter sp. EL27 TaxID=2107580 RepID=UPI000EFAA81A|nr:helix-turn-helix transcriptional regulator [Pseudophaeobacter sp. EL27]